MGGQKLSGDKQTRIRINKDDIYLEQRIMEAFSRKARELVSCYAEKLFKARIGESHPEVIRLKKEVADLKAQLLESEDIMEAAEKMKTILMKKKR
jgi:hypothetical protein